MASLAQLVDHLLPYLEVLGSNPSQVKCVAKSLQQCGCSARLKTSFELNPITEGKQGTFPFLSFNFMSSLPHFPQHKHHSFIIKYTNHMTMTTSGHIMSWSNYLKTKGNHHEHKIAKWRDLWETLIVYILLIHFN